MNELVKLTENYDGKIEEEDQRWHGIVFFDTTRTVCGEALDAGSHFVAKYKSVKRGGITCNLCLQIIKYIKEIKL